MIPNNGCKISQRGMFLNNKSCCHICSYWHFHLFQSKNISEKIGVVMYVFIWRLISWFVILVLYFRVVLSDGYSDAISALTFCGNCYEFFNDCKINCDERALVFWKKNNFNSAKIKFSCRPIRCFRFPPVVHRRIYFKISAFSGI